MLLTIFLLHPDDVEAKSIFTRDFVTLRKVIDFLIFIETFVEITLAAGGAPENIPLVWLGSGETCCFEHRSDQLIVKTEHFIQELAVLNMIGLLVTVELHSVRYHLLLRNVFEHQEVGVVFVVVIIWSWRAALVVEKSLATWVSSAHWRIHSSVCNSCGRIDWLRARTRRNNPLALVFKFFKLAHAFPKLLLSFFFLNCAFTYCVHSFPVDEVASAWAASEFAINAFPVLFEILLDVLESVESRHFIWFLWWRLLCTGLCGWLGLRWQFLGCLSLLQTACLAWVDSLSILRMILGAISLVRLSITASSVSVMGSVLTKYLKLNQNMLCKSNNTSFHSITYLSSAFLLSNFELCWSWTDVPLFETWSFSLIS